MENVFLRNVCKKSLLFLLFFLLPAGAFAANSPASYLQDVKDIKQNRFGPNDIRSFVYRVFAMYDRHVPVGEFLPFLSSKELEMVFPEGKLTSHKDFIQWYDGVGDSIVSNTHNVQSLKVDILGNGKYKVELVVLWQAEGREGIYTSFRFAQTWLLSDGEGEFPVINRYVVRDAGE